MKTLALTGLVTMMSCGPRQLEFSVGYQPPNESVQPLNGNAVAAGLKVQLGVIGLDKENHVYAVSSDAPDVIEAPPSAFLFSDMGGTAVGSLSDDEEG